LVGLVWVGQKMSPGQINAHVIYKK
jgi:hypothetical protein